MVANTIGWRGWLVTALIGLQGFVATAYADEWQEASVVVESTTVEMLSVLVENKEQTVAQITPQIDRVLAPVVDYRAIAKGVMAKYYRRAKPEQIETFIGVFQESLVKTYAKAVVTFNIENFELQTNPGTDTRVGREKIWIKVYADSSVYDIHYTMSNKTGAWKVTNVVLDGVNLGLAFRNQFSASMSDHGNDIDVVIANWNIGSS